MNRALHILLICTLLILPSVLRAENGWTIYRDLEKVKIDYTESQCTFESSGIIADYIFLRLTNKTSENLFVTFKLEYYYNGSCSTCSNDEYRFTFSLPANSSIMPDCSMTGELSRLAIIKKYVNRNFGAPLDKFELTNITIQ